MSSKISMQTLKKQLAQKSKLSVDDYLKHVASNVSICLFITCDCNVCQGSDYLAAIHHMYDSSGSDSEDEQQEREKRRKMQELHEQLLWGVLKMSLSEFLNF